MNVALTSSPRFSRSTYPSTGLNIVVIASASAAAPNETTVSATGRGRSRPGAGARSEQGRKGTSWLHDSARARSGSRRPIGESCA